MRNLVLIPILFVFTYPGFAQDNKALILHEVKAGETLYSLVKRYNTNFATVENLNPEFADGKSDLRVGQIIKFPKINSNSSSSNRNIPEIHIVQGKETVYSISKKYEIDISNLVEANNIVNNNIQIGQTLIVNPEKLTELAAKANHEPELKLNIKGEKKRETGIAEIIQLKNPSNKYLALHRTAPLRSNIKVTNEATGHTIVAQVIGHLNDGGKDQRIMVKLSPSAYYQLRPKDKTLRATVEYFTESGL